MNKKAHLLITMSVIVIIIMGVIFMLTVWKALIESEILAEDGTTSRNLASTFEAAYSAPENVYVSYYIEKGLTGETQGLPVVGTFAWDAGNNEI